jgi:hypothetical protein
MAVGVTGGAEDGGYDNKTGQERQRATTCPVEP